MQITTISINFTPSPQCSHKNTLLQILFYIADMKTFTTRLFSVEAISLETSITFIYSTHYLLFNIITEQPADSLYCGSPRLMLKLSVHASTLIYVISSPEGVECLS